MARLLHDYIGRYEPLRSPLPPLNQSSYTIFSFHDWPGLPHTASHFFGFFAKTQALSRDGQFFAPGDWHPVITSTIFPRNKSGGSVEAPV